MIEGKIGRIREALRGDLPGREAQMLMAPSLRPPGMEAYDGSNPRSSGVMMLLFPDVPGWSTVFILRTPGGSHGGQVALPGGKQEEGDSTLLDTALRETSEEIGVAGSSVETLGGLTPLYVPHSNFLIQPFVGLLKGRPQFSTDPGEVASVLVIPLAELFAPENRKTVVMSRPDTDITAPYYALNGHMLWGATAMMVSEFEQLLISCNAG